MKSDTSNDDANSSDQNDSGNDTGSPRSESDQIIKSDESFQDFDLKSGNKNKNCTNENDQNNPS